MSAVYGPQEATRDDVAMARIASMRAGSLNGPESLEAFDAELDLSCTEASYQRGQDQEMEHRAAVYGPQLPTAADVQVAEAEVNARWGDLIAICAGSTSPAPAEWWQREYEASGTLHAARETAHETRYLSRSHKEEPEAGQ